MAKPRKYGYFKPVVPNSWGDLRFRKKLYQRGRETAMRGDGWKKVEAHGKA